MKKDDSKPKITRVRFPQNDKDYIAKLLVHNLTSWGATEDQAKFAITKGKPCMREWMERWIGHHTDYPDTHVLTQNHVRQGFCAWVHYKATAQILDELHIKEEP